MAVSRNPLQGWAILILINLADMASWFPTAAQSSLQAQRLVASRVVFSRMLQDPILFTGFSTVCGAFGSAASTENTGALQKQRQEVTVLKAKESILEQLRERLNSVDPATDVMLLTIVVLMGLDLVDTSSSYKAVKTSWDTHMSGIDQILSYRKRSGMPHLSEHVRARMSPYTEFFRYLRLTENNSTRRHNIEEFDFSTWPSGLRACYVFDDQVSSSYPIIDSVARIKSACQKFDTTCEQYPQQLVASAQQTLLAACAEILLLSRSHSSPVAEIFLLGLSNYVQHFAHTLNQANRQRSHGGTPPAHPHFSIAPALDPLFSVRCTIWACHPHLSVLLPREAAIRTALCWTGCVLRATLSPRHPGSQLGCRLVRICRSRGVQEDKPELWKLCGQQFWWDDALTARFDGGKVNGC